MSNTSKRIIEARSDGEPGGTQHHKLHMSASPVCEWGALNENEALFLKMVTTIDGEEVRVQRFDSPEKAAKYGQPVLLLVRPHGKHCGCNPVYEYRGFR